MQENIYDEKRPSSLACMQFFVHWVFHLPVNQEVLFHLRDPEIILLNTIRIVYKLNLIMLYHTSIDNTIKCKKLSDQEPRNKTVSGRSLSLNLIRSTFTELISFPVSQNDFLFFFMLKNKFFIPEKKREEKNLPLGRLRPEKPQEIRKEKKKQDMRKTSVYNHCCANGKPCLLKYF